MLVLSMKYINLQRGAVDYNNPKPIMFNRPENGALFFSGVGVGGNSSTQTGEYFSNPKISQNATITSINVSTIYSSASIFLLHR